MPTSTDRSRLASAPKVELHLHLEGAIPLGALWTLTRKYNSDLPDLDALVARFTYKDFPHFLDVWHWKNQFIREEEDFEFIAEAFARSLADQHIVYAEAFFSPTDFARTGLTVGQIAAALRRGLDQVLDAEVALIADLVRDNGPEVAGRVLDEVHESREAGVIGVGIGGSEHHHPPAQFEPVYQRARHLGFQTTAHAGEAAGPESVRDAITRLGVSRIGHGTRAIEDEQVMQLIADHGIHIEACPTSNVRTGVSPSLQSHPLRTFLDRGFSVSVNTDDPVMFNCTMESEFAELQGAGFSTGDIQQLMLNAVDGAWCSDAKKSELRSTMRSFDLKGPG